jgi:hypothetical protein
MRKKEKEITDPAVLEAIIQRALVCRLLFAYIFVSPISLFYNNVTI